MILLLNTVKIVLIALNILPNRMRHKKIMFFIYMGTLVTHGKEVNEKISHVFLRIWQENNSDGEDLLDKIFIFLNMMENFNEIHCKHEM